MTRFTKKKLLPYFETLENTHYRKFSFFYGPNQGGINYKCIADSNRTGGYFFMRLKYKIGDFEGFVLANTLVYLKEAPKG
jgi:hypothetical protein